MTMRAENWTLVMTGCRPRLYRLPLLGCHRRGRTVEDSVVAILVALRKQSSSHEEHGYAGKCAKMTEMKHITCPDGKLRSFYAKHAVLKQEGIVEIYNFRRCFLGRFAARPAGTGFR